VVHQERFDDLARALATNQLSRGQVLKSLVAGVFLATPLGVLWSRIRGEPVLYGREEEKGGDLLRTPLFRLENSWTTT
jgi:hypothetical protein